MGADTQDDRRRTLEDIRHKLVASSGLYATDRRPDDLDGELWFQIDNTADIAALDRLLPPGPYVRAAAPLTKPGWIVWTNEDLTEGRGGRYVKALCRLEATARRLAKGGYVQGVDCPITPVQGRLIDGEWYFPGALMAPSRADEADELILQQGRQKAAEKAAAIERAKALGLSADDIRALSETQP